MLALSQGGEGFQRHEEWLRDHRLEAFVDYVTVSDEFHNDLFKRHLKLLQTPLEDSIKILEDHYRSRIRLKLLRLRGGGLRVDKHSSDLVGLYSVRGDKDRWDPLSESMKVAFAQLFDAMRQ